jgi:ABC-type Fe3+-siderophore transport system permease subunit
LADRPSGGSIKITPPRALAVAALFGALAGWLVVAATNSFDLVAPQVPWTAPVGVFLIAALVGVIAYSTHQRIHVRRQRIEPQRAVAFLVLGKASALAGALVAGGYLTYALMFITRLDAVAPRDRVIKSAVAAVAGVVLAIAGLLLERACRVPKSDDDEEEVEDAEA